MAVCTGDLRRETEERNTAGGATTTVTFRTFLEQRRTREKRAFASIHVSGFIFQLPTIKKFFRATIPQV
jgi:hypothetical protein